MEVSITTCAVSNSDSRPSRLLGDPFKRSRASGDWRKERSISPRFDTSQRKPQPGTFYKGNQAENI